jgi:NADH-quinone oxidoreductase subunit E
VGNDETTADGKITLEHIECNAACDYAPVMMVNWEFMDNMTPAKATQLVDDLRSGAEVRSTRGPRVVTWRQAERVLAGFPDGLADEGPSAGPASLVGLGIARENGWTAPESPRGLDTAVGGRAAPRDEGRVETGSTTDQGGSTSEHGKSAEVEESSSSDKTAAEKDEAK